VYINKEKIVVYIFAKMTLFFPVLSGSKLKP